MSQKNVTPNWFSQRARGFFYANDPFQSLNDFLNKWISGSPETDEEVSTGNTVCKNQEDEQLASRYYWTTESAPYYILNCKELGGAIPNNSMTYRLQGRKLVPYQDETNRFCHLFRINFEEKNIYSAAKYPISAPVTYFQGSLDGATPMDQALEHFKNSPKSFAQMLVRTGGGHGPIEEILVENAAAKNIFLKALSGLKLNEKDLEGLESEGSWSYYLEPAKVPLNR
jgi:proline iminopeptidase